MARNKLGDLSVDGSSIMLKWTWNEVEGCRLD